MAIALSYKRNKKYSAIKWSSTNSYTGHLTFYNLVYVCTDESYGMESFTDGLWHSVSIDVLASQGSSAGLVNVTVDGLPDISNRRLHFTSASKFYIGGMYVYTGWAKKTAHGLQFNNFVYSQPIFIIFGRYKAYEICNWKIYS